MTAQKLRAAAALMRERAEAATPGPWEAWSGASGGGGEYVTSLASEGRYTFGISPGLSGDAGWRIARADAAHIAAADPPFMLAVAAWLERTADDFDQWHGVRAACRDLDARGEETDEGVACTCSYKDCYEHGKWHNCVHGMPNTDAALAVADAYLADDARLDAR